MAWQAFLKFPNNKCKQNRFINFTAVLCTQMDMEKCKDGCKAHLLCTFRKTDWLQPCELVSIAASRAGCLFSFTPQYTHKNSPSEILTQYAAPCLFSRACTDLQMQILGLELKTKLRGLSPRANYTDRAAAAGRRSYCQLLRTFYWDWKQAKNGPSAMSETSAVGVLSF
jgi:hypothetical protein